jgi:DNA-binding NarL/FixJ family response regulator
MGDSGRWFRTLIVEDNATFRQTLLESLSARFPAMIIAEASAGQEVLPKIETLFPDLIFMDIKIPGENGLALTQKIKSRYPETIVIILTSFDLPEYRQAAYERGADYFLVKGSSTNEEILELVESILSNSGFNLEGSKR